MVDAEEIERLIRLALPDAEVAVYDLTGGGDHYKVDVVSATFTGMPQIKRHRLVYAPLRDVLGGALHALALTTRTPDEQQQSHEIRGSA